MNHKKSELSINRLGPSEVDAAARLIHGALAHWYGKNLNQPDKFGAEWEPFRIFPQVYEGLDPNSAVAARDGGTGDLLGVCFFHPRPRHVSVGIVAVDPAAGGRGVARAMVEEVLAVADAAGLPVRLVSSLFNLESFSLYTRLGFVPGMVFQDMVFPVGVLPALAEVPDGVVRVAELRDVAAMAALEGRLTGMDRAQDFAYFVRNDPPVWHTLVLLGKDGELRGFLSSFNDGVSAMLGPGQTETEGDAMALIARQLHYHAPAVPVLLVSARSAGLVAALYAAGARNLELHVAQVRGVAQVAEGVVIPTFLPESG